MISHMSVVDGRILVNEESRQQKDTYLYMSVKILWRVNKPFRLYHSDWFWRFNLWNFISPKISWLLSRLINLIHKRILSIVLISKKIICWFHIHIPEEHGWAFVHFSSFDLLKMKFLNQLKWSMFFVLLQDITFRLQE
jgi:hypothetical protein